MAISLSGLSLALLSKAMEHKTNLRAHVERLLLSIATTNHLQMPPQMRATLARVMAQPDSFKLDDTLLQSLLAECELLLASNAPLIALQAEEEKRLRVLVKPSTLSNTLSASSQQASLHALRTRLIQLVGSVMALRKVVRECEFILEVHELIVHKQLAPRANAPGAKSRAGIGLFYAGATESYSRSGHRKKLDAQSVFQRDAHHYALYERLADLMTRESDDDDDNDDDDTDEIDPQQSHWHHLPNLLRPSAREAKRTT